MKKVALTATTSMMALMMAVPATADDFSDLWEKGKGGVDFRYRLETVDQDNALRDATANTLLTKLWYKSGSVNGFSGFVEMTNTTSIGSQKYNSTTNGNTDRSVIADPETTELNQAYIQYSNDLLTVKAGRQGINLDNMRFIGTVGWRQNDQTYDAVLAALAPTKNLSVAVAHVRNVNRIFGEDHPFGDLDTATSVLHATYDGKEFGKLTGYAYLIDLTNPAVFGLSSKTYGLRYEGKRPITESVKLGYELEYATQSDYQDNPNDYSADYFHGGVSVATNGFTFGANYELLGSDNGIGFSTPLATLHKFNGWGDQFLSTPGTGLQDMNISAAYKVPGNEGLGGTLFKVVYHDFESDVNDISYGNELDLLVSRKLTKNLTGAIKAAFYNADAHSVDTDKIWFYVSAKF